MLKFNKLLVIVFLFTISVVKPSNVKAQIIELGATGGLSYYLGDINPGTHFSQCDFGWGASLRYYQNSRWVFRFQYSNLNLKAADAKSSFRPERAMSFQSKINDYALMAEFNFFDYWTGSMRNYVTPYIFAGLSMFTYDSVISEEGEQLPIDGAEQQTTDIVISNHAFSVPFGLGVKYSVNKRIGLTAEWRIHKSFTDFIDAIGIQRNDPSAPKLAYGCDWFSIFGLTLSYKFNMPHSNKCNAGMEERFYRYY